MFTRRPFTTLLVSLLAVACEPEPIAPKAGLYTVEVDVLTDDCTPNYAVGSYRTHVRLDADGLRFGISQALADGPEDVEDALFERADGDLLEFVGEPRTEQIGCMTVTRTTTVTLGHDEYFVASEEEQWVQADGCTDPVDPDAIVPASACTAERTFALYLDLACEDSCTLVMEPTPRCDCA